MKRQRREARFSPGVLYGTRKINTFRNGHKGVILRTTKLWLLMPLALTAVALTGLATGHYAAHADTSGKSMPGTRKDVKHKDVSAATGRALTFTRDIAPIVYQNCTGLPSSGRSGSVHAVRYKDAQKRARQIALVTASHAMPPWKTDSQDEFQDERRLTDAQIALIKTWVDQGAKEGNPAEMPPAAEIPRRLDVGRSRYDRAASGGIQSGRGRARRVPLLRGSDQFHRRPLGVGHRRASRQPRHRASHHRVCGYNAAQRGTGRKLQDLTGPAIPRSAASAFSPPGMLGGWAPGATAALPARRHRDSAAKRRGHRAGSPLPQETASRKQIARRWPYISTRGQWSIRFIFFPLHNTRLYIPPGESNHEEHQDLPGGIPSTPPCSTFSPHAPAGHEP